MAVFLSYAIVTFATYYIIIEPLGKNDMEAIDPNVAISARRTQIRTSQTDYPLRVFVNRIYVVRKEMRTRYYTILFVAVKTLNLL